MSRLALGALSIAVVVSACSRAGTPLAGDAAAEGTEVGAASPDAPAAHDVSEAGDASEIGDAGEVGEAGSCQGPVVFRLEAPDPSAWFAIDPFQDGPAWVSIDDASGVADQIGRPPLHLCTSASCGTCEFDGICGAAFTKYPLPATLIWDGTFFPPGHCGAEARVCVNESSCAQPGHYVARMCASPKSNSNVAQTCVDVPFDLPASGAVVGTLPP